MAKPNPGDEINVPSMIYLSHGADDFQGGLCKVAATRDSMQSGKAVTFKEIEEDPGSWKLWDTYLEPMQESLKEKFGNQKGKLDTDLRPEFNRGWLPDPD